VNIGIVGGGMLGMTVAWRAVAEGHSVTILEASSRCGGLAAPWSIGDCVWDRHYHVTLLSDTNTRGLLAELDLSGETHFVPTQTGFYVDGRMSPFTTVLDFLRFPPLSLWQKGRLGTTILKASRITDWKPLEQITAVDWLTKQCGRATVDRIWLPLLRAKLGPYAHRASAAFIWAIIARMYAARRAGAKRELFGYVRGGYETVLRRFEQRLAARGVEIRTSRRVQCVTRSGPRVTVMTDDGVSSFDQVLVTLASPLVPRIVPDLTRTEQRLHNGIEYQGIVCASLLSERALTPYYITNIADASIPFTAVIEMTALVEREKTFHGRSLIYLPKYVAPDDVALTWDDEEVQNLFLTELRRMHPQLRADDVRAFRISRVPYVFPVPTLGYSDRLPPVATSVPGVFAANSAHIVNGTLNVNETVGLADQVWNQMKNSLPFPLHAEVV
jgi:protoporphyrinogen oxidase